MTVGAMGKYHIWPSVYHGPPTHNSKLVVDQTVLGARSGECSKESARPSRWLVQVGRLSPDMCLRILLRRSAIKALRAE